MTVRVWVCMSCGTLKGFKDGYAQLSCTTLFRPDGRPILSCCGTMSITDLTIESFLNSANENPNEAEMNAGGKAE